MANLIVAQRAGNSRLCARTADSDDVARVYRFEVAQGFRDDLGHLSDLISLGAEAFWLVDFVASTSSA
jgi:hypothetical protein